jgi:hypothetical protein
MAELAPRIFLYVIISRLQSSAPLEKLCPHFGYVALFIIF